MNTEQAYINGFVKRATEYGLDYSEALNLLKSAEKPGLWANIRAKRARGEKPAKPGDEDYPDKKQWSKLTKSAYSYSDEMGEMNRWLDGGSPWSNRLHKDFYKDPKGVAALTKHFTDIVRSQGADIKFLSDSYYDDKTIKMSPEEAINKLLAQKELKFNADDAPNYYQIMYPFEQIGKFKWQGDKHPSQLSIDEYLKTLNTKTADSAAWQRSEGKNPEGGLNAKGRASYKAQTGGTLKAPVTENNPKGERAKRQNSFCSRMCGMKRVNTGSKAQNDPDSRINKSLRKWNCKCGEAHDSFLAKLGCVIKESRCWDGYEPVPGKEPYSEDSCRPKNSKKEKKNEKSAAPAMRLPAAKPTVHKSPVAAPVKAQPKMIAPMKASPEMPYAETRATLDDLSSFPISEDDFLKGGGKLMFQDPVKTPAAAPTIAQQ